MCQGFIKTDIRSFETISEKCLCTLSCRLAKLCLCQSYTLAKGATDPNTPERKSALFWTLLPQLFVQFDAQLLFELLNTQAEAIPRNRRPPNEPLPQL